MNRDQIRKGMTVRSVEGDKLGKVAGISGDTFIIEKGLLFKEDFEARLDGIVDLRDDEIIYQRAADTEPRTAAVSAGEDRVEMAPAAEPIAGGETRARSEEELRVPIVEEELDVEKRALERGGVRVTKEVVTEEKQVTVPVRREEIVVDRVPAAGEAPPASAGAFVEREINVPIVEEEVTVTKRPVVREEVRVRKQQVQEQRAVSADVRHEEAHIEELEEQRRDRPADVGSEPGMRAPARDDDDIKR